VVRRTIGQWLGRAAGKARDGIQVAFYGGSFTGLPMQRQRELLESVTPYIADGRVDSVRISTRPDYIDEEIIGFLKEFSVNVVELGVQSLDQQVLDASGRGHTVEQAEESISLLKDRGFSVGVQLMCGLPEDTTSTLLATVNKAAGLAPDFARIYPALVIRGSVLEQLYRTGKYRPLSLNRAVALCAHMKTIFDHHHIRVVRMGLQVSPELSAQVVAGPYHPAFGELVSARLLFKKTRHILRTELQAQHRFLSIAALDESAFRGPDNVSMKRLQALGLLDGVELVFDPEQQRNSVTLC
jgi:histone acetyltransferase (RNA polymerase elongator complex component)